MRLGHGAIPLMILVLAAGAPCGPPAAQSLPPRAEAAGGGFSPAFIAKMLKLIALKGIDRETPAPFAAALGLTAPGMTWKDRQVAANGDGDGALRGFAVSRRDDQDVVLSYRLGDLLMGYRARRDGELVTAFSFSAQTKQITRLTPAEAEAAFSRERKFWNDNVDFLTAAPK